MEYSVLLAAQAAQHPPWAALSLAALQLAGTAAVLAVLAARGGWRFGTGRWILLGGAAALMAGWPFAHAPGTAMCLVLAVEGAAMVLVMIGAYRHPASETPLTWQAFILAGLFDLPALGSRAPRLLYVYPAFFVVMGAGVLIAAALGARAVPVPAALVQRARIQQAMAERAQTEPGRSHPTRGQRRLLRAAQPAPPARGRPAQPASGPAAAAARTRPSRIARNHAGRSATGGAGDAVKADSVRVVAVRTRLAIASSGASPARSVSTKRASALTTATRSVLSRAIRAGSAATRGSPSGASASSISPNRRPGRAAASSGRMMVAAIMARTAPW